MTNEKHKEEFEEEFEVYMNNQFRILKGHHSRIMLRCWNKFLEMKREDDINESKEVTPRGQND